MLPSCKGMDRGVGKQHRVTLFSASGAQNLYNKQAIDKLVYGDH